jgi:hypothetical protein
MNKSIAIYNATQVSLKQKLCFIEQKCIFEHLRKVKTRKNLENDIILKWFCLPL